ncbi:hypothetical protein DLAC_06151 [Tieghemostelium lacteum]|uniref:Uncharacterized protein n=1 Tax=Tieghemostelium lacteum TaxID=361077 RepID=A0A151ZHT3_TIELA|nr:hypothetical protein DLAC_06151 [Tieghemostelium lacteum]|eukprot:KYQ93459.1 hypothetical protein DLAC_06151 [Tieghemostelium lacteum]
MNSQLPPPDDIIIYSEEVNEFIERIKDPLTQSERDIFSTIVDMVRHDYMFMSKFLKWFDEYQPNCHNEQHYKTVMLLDYYNDMTTLYRKSIYRKLLESKDPTIINTLLHKPTTLHYNLQQNLNECSLPLSLFLDISEYEDVTHNWYFMACAFINQIYFPDGSSVNRQEVEKNFINRDELIRKEKFSLQTIKEVIQVFLKGEKHVIRGISHNSENLLFYLCILTFQNLTKEDILELKDDYIQLIPFIYQHSASSRLPYYSRDGVFTYRIPRNQTHESFARSFNNRERSQQPNYLHYLIHYYGIEIIEKESLNFYSNWKSKPKQQRYNTTLFTFAEYMIESIFIRDHLQDLYDYFWDAIDSSKNNYVYFLSVWGLYIERYGFVQPKHFNNLIKYLSKNCKIKNKDQNSQHPTLYEFYTTLLASKPGYTISNFKGIVTNFTNKPCNFIIYLNQLLLKPSIIHSIKTNKNFTKLYNVIKRVGSRSPEDFCYLLEFFMEYEKVSEYTKMIPQFIGAINSNKKWLVRDESFFDPILRFYSIIKQKNPKEAKQLFEKTIRSFIKTLESDNKSSMVKFDVIYPYLSDIKEINYLFKQSKELLNDSDQFIEIFKHFIDLDQIGEKFIQEILDSMIDMEFKSTNKNQKFRILGILDGMSRFVNLDTQITKLMNRYFQTVPNLNFHLYTQSMICQMTFKLLRNLLDISNGYERFVESFLSVDYTTVDTNKNPYKTINLFFEEDLKVFDSVHQLIFNNKSNHIDIPQQDIIRIHNQLVSGIINKLNLVDLSMHSINMILMYFKPLISLDSSLQDNLLKQFKSFDVVSKKRILQYIKENDILVLEYLNDFTLTGLTFNHNKIEQNLNNQTPYIQNLIIQKFVEFITRDKSTKPSDILSLSLVSKLFFKSVCLTFQQYKIQLKQKLPDKYQLSRRKWSFMSLGCYHLNYKDLERFHYQDVEDIFYQLSSLTIHKPMIYLVNREMSNLTHLDIEIRNDMSLSCILQMMNHCFKLQSVKFSFINQLNSKRILQIDAIFKKLILNNTSTLDKLYFGYPATNITECIESIQSIIDHIIDYQISHPTTFKYQIALTFKDTYDRDSIPNLDRIVSLISTCTHLILENFNKIEGQLKPNLFLNLQSIFIQVDKIYQFYREVLDFIMSPEIKLESLTILGPKTHHTFKEMELLKKPNLKKVNFILPSELPEQYINSIISLVNQNQSIKSLKLFNGDRYSSNIPGQIYKLPYTTDVKQLNLGEFHSINTNHFIKY